MSAELAAVAGLRNHLAPLLSIPVFDMRAPQQGEKGYKPMPYCVLSSSTTNTADTDNTLGFDLSLDIHTWDDSRPCTRFTVSEFQQEIYDALHRFDTLSIGVVYRLIGIDQTLQTIMLDPDGITRHGVQSFRMQFEPVNLAV